MGLAVQLEVVLEEGRARIVLGPRHRLDLHLADRAQVVQLHHARLGALRELLLDGPLVVPEDVQVLVGRLLAHRVQRAARLAAQPLEGEHFSRRSRMGRRLRRSGQLGQPGGQQRLDGHRQHPSVVADDQLAQGHPVVQRLEDLLAEHRLEGRPERLEARQEPDRPGPVLVQAGHQIVGHGRAVKAGEDQLRCVQVVLHHPLAEGIAAGEGEVAFLPAQAVADALAGLRRQVLEHVLGGHPPQLHQHRAHLLPAGLGL